jgi:hypothetical protein
VNLWKRFLRWKRNEAYWEQSAATKSLQHAWSYLFQYFWSQASAQERGRLLAENQEALDILLLLTKDSLDRQCEL